MIINREFTKTHDFELLIICQIEKEIERIISAAYNSKQVDIVANKNGGRQK
ncbi:hypothetical protein ACR0S5_24200 [Priestia megaterium]|uniref:hypothetical protein n=1 Tax=Priestia megaterium TaxID=1404 RepID=UPI003D971A90